MIFWQATGKELKGNLHTHTTNSDGRLSPKQAHDVYRENGYDFLAITDHRFITDETHLEGGLLLLSALEMDYNDFDGRQVAHVIALGVKKGFEKQVSYGVDVQGGINAVVENGGLPILAHPAWSLNTLEFLKKLKNVSITEIYNTVSGLPWNSDRADSSDILDVCAANGVFFRYVASGDAHYYTSDHCKAFTMLQAEKNEASVLNALREGKFYASQGPRFEKIEFDGEKLSVETSPVSTIFFSSDAVWDGTRAVSGESLTRAVFTPNMNATRAFLRVVAVDALGRKAWSNPILLNQG